MILQERFLGGIPFDQARFVREREPETIDNAVKFALTYESAKQATVSDHERPKNRFGNKPQQSVKKGEEEEKKKVEGAQRQPQHNRGRNPDITC